MSSEDDTPTRVRWARLRFSIVGPLLHSPPEDRELAARLSELASQAWKHPTAGDVVRFSFKTIERWYYLAKSDDDPMRSLERKVPKHAGTHPAISPALGEAIERQYRDHPRWSYQLHHDNLVVLAREDPRLGRLPGYATIRRYMRDKGLVRSKRRPREEVSCFAPRETRSYEVTHVHGLWHLDFHQCSRAVLRSDGSWKKPLMLGVLDDHSRLCCHGQWYLDETAEALVHGLSQGIQKRGRPRAMLTDNGAAMLAAETTEGLERLGIVHCTTLASRRSAKPNFMTPPRSRENAGMRRPTSCVGAQSIARGKTLIWPNAVSCSSTRPIASSPTPSRRTGTRSCGYSPTRAARQNGRARNSSSPRMQLCESGSFP